MAMGRREDQGHTPELWIATSDLPRTGGHSFYQRLNQILAAHEFDAFVEGQCARFYAATRGRPSLPPGTYFRLLLIGYFAKKTITGTMTLGFGDYYDLGAFGCSGDDIEEGAQVIVRNDRNRAIAVSELRGAVRSSSCILPFKVKVPDSKFYEIEVSHRSGLTYTKKDPHEAQMAGRVHARLSRDATRAGR